MGDKIPTVLVGLSNAGVAPTHEVVGVPTEASGFSFVLRA